MLKKSLFFNTLISVSTLAIVPNVINNQNQLLNKDSSAPENQNEEMVFEVINALVIKKPTDGSSLRQGKNVSLALPLLWDTITSLKAEAIRQVEAVPGIGAQLVKLVEGIQESDLTLDNDNLILNKGDNLLAMTLKIGNAEFPLTMKLTNVSS